ncbi:putative innexin-3 [Necator americanus]|nr:putative innexin-3 [Necator americanus]ETN68302.1 putative innexin-3 [Necator americanus]
MIGAIVPYVSKIRRSYQSNDLIDRLNYQYTAMLVALGAITLAATQYVGKPIQCWVPAQFTGAWEKYAETYCFIKGSYFLPDDEHPNEDFIERDNAVIGYYQWVPLMLALQAFLFYVPCIVWKALNCSTGINVKDVLENTAKVKKNVTVKERENQVSKAATHLQEALELQRELKSEAGMLSKMRKSGFYLSAVYVFTKFLYVFNIFAQFCIFSAFLGTNNSFWGWEIFRDIWSGREWNVTGHFPRVTMCDFTVRVLGALHRWTVQCVLMINMFTEKIYVFLWFWFILVGVLSVISLIYWLIALVGTNFQRGFVTKYLRCMGEINEPPSRIEEEKVGGFVRNYLTSDGVFLLRLIQTNGGDMLAGEIIAAMFRQYNERRKAPMSEDSFGDSPDTTATLPR